MNLNTIFFVYPLEEHKTKQKIKDQTSNINAIEYTTPSYISNYSRTLSLLLYQFFFVCQFDCCQNFGMRESTIFQIGSTFFVFVRQNYFSREFFQVRRYLSLRDVGDLQLVIISSFYPRVNIVFGILESIERICHSAIFVCDAEL